MFLGGRGSHYARLRFCLSIHTHGVYLEIKIPVGLLAGDISLGNKFTLTVLTKCFHYNLQLCPFHAN